MSKKRSIHDAVTNLRNLYEGTKAFPGYQFTWNDERQTRFKDAEKNLSRLLDEVVEMGIDCQCRMARLQQAVAAFLEYREMIPLSTLNVRAISAAGGKGKGESKFVEQYQDKEYAKAHTWFDHAAVALWQAQSQYNKELMGPWIKSADQEPSVDAFLNQHVRTTIPKEYWEKIFTKMKNNFKSHLTQEILEELELIAHKVDSNTKIAIQTLSSIRGETSSTYLETFEEELREVILDYRERQEQLSYLRDLIRLDSFSPSKDVVVEKQKNGAIRQCITGVAAAIDAVSQAAANNKKSDDENTRKILSGANSAESKQRTDFQKALAEFRNIIESKIAQAQKTIEESETKRQQKARPKKRKPLDEAVIFDVAVSGIEKERKVDDALSTMAVEGSGAVQGAIAIATEGLPKVANDIPDDTGSGSTLGVQADDQSAPISDALRGLAVQVITGPGNCLELKNIVFAGRAVSPFSGTMGSHQIAWVVLCDIVESKICKQKLGTDGLKTVLQSLAKLPGEFETPFDGSDQRSSNIRINMKRALTTTIKNLTANMSGTLKELAEKQESYSTIAGVQNFVLCLMSAINLVPGVTIQTSLPRGASEGLCRSTLCTFEKQGFPAIEKEKAD